MGASIVAAAVVFFVVAGLLLYLIIMYNELVRLRNDNDRAWANIDVLLEQPQYQELRDAVHEARVGFARCHQAPPYIAVQGMQGESAGSATLPDPHDR